MRNMEPNRYQISIDLKPALSLEQLDTRLQKDFAENQNKDFINSLGALLPRKLIPIMVAKIGDCTKSKMQSNYKRAETPLCTGIKRIQSDDKGISSH